MRFKLLLFGFLLCLGSEIYAQNTVTVKGFVFESDGSTPLIGVNVVVGSGGTGTLTREDGSYSIDVSEGSRLTYLYIGYKKAEFICPTGKKEVIHNVNLAEQVEMLTDVVVVAYGTRKKGTITGSVATVKSETIENVPAASFDQALQGKATGLTVLSNTGEPGAAASFKIRGTNSINSGTQPLFILDGIAISNADFNAISPADIESISVLKDASSTSIYGARAANGVVVITTKRGRMSDDARIIFRSQLGFSGLAQGRWDMMNTAERIQYEKEVGIDAGQNYDQLSKININWLDEVFRKNALMQNYELQVSGASPKVNYFVSGSFFSQEGISLDSDFSRYSLRSNLRFTANKWLTVGTNTMLAYEEMSQSDYGSYTTYAPISAARFMMPYWNPYKKDGSLASSSDGSWKGTGVNPLEWAENNPYTPNKYKVFSTVYTELRPIEGLTIRTNLGIDYTHRTVRTLSYPEFQQNNGVGRAARSSSDAMSLTISNTANYMFDIDRKHHFNVLVGQEGVSYSSEGFSVGTSGQSNNDLPDVGSGTIARSWSSNSEEYAYLSFFGRGEYNYDDRYFADLSMRSDGSSRFGKQGRWATFWSAGLMWNVRNEKFLKEKYKWLTTFQMNFSIGTTGNSSIPNYDHLSLVSRGPEYAGNASIVPSTVGNDNLEWEKVWTSNLGIQLGFWNRADLKVELYNKKTTNMLMAIPVSYADTGAGYKWGNVGSMVNRGAEISVGFNIIRNKTLMWYVGANASYNYNEITELYNGQNEYVLSTSGTKLVVGHSMGEFFLNRFAGVNSANGDPLWLTKDGEVTNVYKESDKVMIDKSSVAPWQGGFDTQLSWKQFSLSAQFSWVANRWMLNNDRYFEENSLFGGSYNLSRRMLYDRWKKPGDVTDIPRYGTTPQFDTHLLEDASFLRLKNVSLSYSLTKKMLRSTRILTDARIYMQAQNLLTFTKFSGLDPESTSNIYQAQYPMSRQFTFGVELSF